MLAYPLDVRFKVVTLGTRVSVTDATGTLIAYVRKKKFKLKEDVMAFADEDQNRPLFRMKADRVVDFGASYAISTPDGRPIGAVKRHGMRSMWKSAYGIADAFGAEVGKIQEENPWVKVFDGLLEVIPFVGDVMGGVFFHPAYLVDLHDKNVLRLQKQRSVFESAFRLEKRGDFTEDEETLLLASVIMMVLLERDRG